MEEAWEMSENVGEGQHSARGCLSFLCRRPSHIAPDLVAKPILDVGFLGRDKPVSPRMLMVLAI